MDLPLLSGTINGIENGSLTASGFQVLIEVTRLEDDHRFSAIFTYESKGESFIILIQMANSLGPEEKCSSVF